MKKLSLFIVRFISLLSLVLPVSALADPGHGIEEVPGWSMLHFLIEPKHAVSIGAVLLVSGIVLYRILKEKSSQGRNHDRNHERNHE